MSNRKDRRGALVKARRAEKKGHPVVGLTVSALTEPQLKLFKEHGRMSPLLFRSLLWVLRSRFDEARAEGKNKGKEIVPTFWTLAVTDAPEGEPAAADSEIKGVPSWRSGSNPLAYEIRRAMKLARDISPGLLFSTSKDAPDGERGHMLYLEHQAFVGIVEQHHWSERYGWRIYDGLITKSETGPVITWTLREETT